MAKKKAPAKKTPAKKATKKVTKKAATKKAPKTSSVKKKKASTDDVAPVKKKKAKRKTRAKAAADVRQRVYWGVFNHAMKRVALYEFNQRKAAEKRASDLSPEGKPPHFVQKVKEDISE